MSAFKSFFLLLIFLIALWAFGFFWFICQIPCSSAPSQETTDAIVVLTGGGQRLEHGFNLLAEGRATKMFISGVEDSVTLPSLMHKKELRVYTPHIFPQRIILGYKAHSTRGNARETGDWVLREHINSIRLVTGNYHIPRSLYEFHRIVPQLKIIPEPVFPVSGVRFYMLTLSEYHKYMASIFMHTFMEQ